MEAVILGYVVIIRVKTLVLDNVNRVQARGDCIKTGKANEVATCSVPSKATRQTHVFGHVQLLQAVYTPSFASIARPRWWTGKI
jgi:hypothetical protein